MAQTPTANFNTEVDRVVLKITSWLEKHPPEAPKPLTLSREEALWLLAEIEGGREAFGAIVDSNEVLLARVASMQGTINTLTSMRNRG